MHRSFIRSTLFNLAFYSVTVICCLIFIPLFLLPRTYFLYAVKAWLRIVAFLERWVLGLKLDIRGRQHLPESGSYIIAAKHQSAYETFKLHLVFSDPAIVLKQELLKIPLWGAYLQKSGVIAIDRSAHAKALMAAGNEAVKVAAENRPLIIFPQGTRVKPDDTPETKPYKPGIFRLYDSTQLPIIPMALNSGVFWPRTGWLKSGGTVVFEFLPPIPPGLPRKDVMRELEASLESASNSLTAEARAAKIKTGTKIIHIVLAGLIIMAGFGYTALWRETADNLQQLYKQLDIDPLKLQHIGYGLKIDGFPGPIRATASAESITTNDIAVTIADLEGRIWPLPYIPAHLHAKGVSLQKPDAQTALIVDTAEAVLYAGHYKNLPVITMKSLTLTGDGFVAKTEGIAIFSELRIEKLEMTLTLEGHGKIIKALIDQNVMSQQDARLLEAGLTLFAKDGRVTIPLSLTNGTLYAGPLRLLRIEN